MKATGIVRNIDELGRIVIPKEMRRKMDISNNDPVEIFVEDDKIILVKYSVSCTFCGSNLGVSDFRGKRLCADCISQIKAMP